MCCDAAQVCLKSFRWKLINSVEWNYDNLKKKQRERKKMVYFYLHNTNRQVTDLMVV